MIDLTPLEVRKKKGDFRRTMRGYEPSLVDDFLDLAADRMEELVRENLSLHERLSRQDQQVAEYRERERALTEALVTAQEMREEIRRQSKREAELALQAAEQETKQLRTGAEQEVTRLRNDAQQEVARLRAEAEVLREREDQAMQRLRSRQRQFLGSYRAFLERELTELAVIAQTLGVAGGQPAGSTPTGAAPASRHSNTLEMPAESYEENATQDEVDDHTGTGDDGSGGAGSDDDRMNDAPEEAGEQAGFTRTTIPIGLDARSRGDEDLEPFEPEPFEPEPFEPFEAGSEAGPTRDTDFSESEGWEPAPAPKPERAPQAASLGDLTLVGSDDVDDMSAEDEDEDDDEDGGDAGLLLRNAAAAGYRLPETDELLLDTPVSDDGVSGAEDGDDEDDGGDDSWLPTLLDDQR